MQKEWLRVDEKGRRVRLGDMVARQEGSLGEGTHELAILKLWTSNQVSNPSSSNQIIPNIQF